MINARSVEAHCFPLLHSPRIVPGFFVASGSREEDAGRVMGSVAL